ncbi:outer dynein arm protein 1 [Cyclospora cayetanensis]|uniref:Outer dynein arm docking complex protein n=2 Tax=Cyclospora cayetanensis TaxID=88456 RepID=A0A1D3CXM0_9EIME|nr:outer dynein arm protein 1 [Cyclospora cayetanensis]OEH75947.1 outer dynein arm docking complex protein [Cyclospora cayetanensis]
MEPPEGLPLAEQITEVKRKLRLVSQEAKAFGDSAQIQIRKQRSAIEKLKAENAAIKDELQLTREALSQQQNTLLGTRMQSLNEQCQDLLHEIAEEKKEEHHLAENIQIMEGRVKKCREVIGSFGGVYAAEVTSEAIEKQTHILENRLDKALQKHSQAVAHNRKLKDEINCLRRERVTFSHLYKKAENDLIAHKKAVLDLIKEANQAYTEREEAQKSIATLKADAAKERKSFETEWAHLQQFLEGLQMRQWNTQQAKRVADLKARREADCEHEAQRKEGCWGSNEDITSLCDTTKVRSYQAAFAKIQAATGISSVEQLIEALRVAEEHNFSLFCYVNSLSDEVEAHEAAIHDLRTSLKSCTDLQQAESRKKTEEVREWEGQWHAIQEKVKSMEAQNKSATEQLKDIMQKTRVMFEIVGAGKRHKEELWATEEVAEVTITNYLQAVEEAVEDMLERLLCPAQSTEIAVAAASQKQQKISTRGQPKTNAGHAKQTQQIKVPSAINRTSSLDTSEEEDGETRPLSREELKRKLQISKARKSEREKNKQKKQTSK